MFSVRACFAEIHWLSVPVAKPVRLLFPGFQCIIKENRIPSPQKLHRLVDSHTKCKPLCQCFPSKKTMAGTSQILVRDVQVGHQGIKLQQYALIFSKLLVEMQTIVQRLCNLMPTVGLNATWQPLKTCGLQSKSGLWLILCNLQSAQKQGA